MSRIRIWHLLPQEKNSKTQTKTFYIENLHLIHFKLIKERRWTYRHSTSELDIYNKDQLGQFLACVKRSTQEMLLSKKLHLPLKGCRTDWCIDFIEWIHSKLKEKKILVGQVLPDAKLLYSDGRELTLIYKSYTSLKKFLIPSSCRTSCSMMNLICTANS